MRITNNMIQRNASSAMQTHLQRMSQSQSQVSTGQRFQSFAEDPQAQSNVMQSSGSLRAIEQYRRNVSDAKARSAAEEIVLDQLSNTLDRARQIAVEQGSSTSNAETRAGAKAEIDNLLDFVVSLGNTKYLDGYLFGGDDTVNAPMTNTPPFFNGTAPSGQHNTEISAGQLFKSNHNGKELLLDTGVLAALKQLSDSLGANNTAQISSTITDITNAHAGVQALVGDLGARVNQLEVTDSNLDALQANLQTFKSSLSEVDYETAMTELLSRQTAYQAAMLATSRVIGMTLTDYLR